MPAPPPPMGYIWPGIIAAQAMHAAAKLRIADSLAAGPKSIAELASDCGANPAALTQLLRALGTLEMFEMLPDGRFQNSPLSDTLRADHPQSRREWSLFLPAAFLWRPLGELYESVRTGEPAFERIFGERFFQYLSSHPDDARLFNATMTQGSASTGPALAASYDFSRFQKLVDVGGGEGALLREILKATPKLEGVLFDLPEVVPGAAASERCAIVGGNFFEAVPAGADAYLLKGVIHDWQDEAALKILRNVRRAIPADGTLLLLEALADSATRPAGMMELLMLVIGGLERTEAGFRALLAEAGFVLTRVIPTEASSILECHPVR